MTGFGCTRCGRVESAQPRVPEAQRRENRGCDRPGRLLIVDRATKQAEAHERCPFADARRFQPYLTYAEVFQLTGEAPFGASRLGELPGPVRDAIVVCLTEMRAAKILDERLARADELRAMLTALGAKT